MMRSLRIYLILSIIRGAKITTLNTESVKIMQLTRTNGDEYLKPASGNAIKYLEIEHIIINFGVAS
jgi:hypothetical protein